MTTSYSRTETWKNTSGAVRNRGRASRVRLDGARWILWFIAFQFATQIALLVPQAPIVRVGLRIGAFGASLALLLYLRGRGQRHPAAPFLGATIAILLLSFFNPGTNNLLSGIAHIALYLAILAPVFWVSRLRVTTHTLRQTILLLWCLNTASAGVGILQVYYPGRFQPALSSVIVGQGEGYVGSLYITTASGERVFRPMGLTDTPGGAGSAGMYAVLLGMGLFLVMRGFWTRVALGASMAAGITAIYLSQVRATLLMTAACVMAFVMLLGWRGRIAKVGMIASLVALVAILSFAWAVALAGRTVPDRLATLWEDPAGDVYYQNRGVFLEQTASDLLPRYPFGAGLGRWGMMEVYFGNTDPLRPSIWVEIQWTAWLIDGGVPLIVAYTAALVAALGFAFRLVRTRELDRAPELWTWAALILAYNVGAVALTFSYPVFIGQLGLQFWLLNATLFSALVWWRREVAASHGRTGVT